MGVEVSQVGVEVSQVGVSANDTSCQQRGKEEEGGGISCPTCTTMNCSAESGCSGDSSNDDDCDDHNEE